MALLCSAAHSAAQQPQNDVEAIRVQGNVYMLAGAGGNIAVQVGDEGILVVDTGLGETSEKVVAAIRKLSPGPIRWIVNTSGDPDHTGGNDVVSHAGKTVNGNAAAIHAHENVLTRMDKSGVPESAWPLNTYYESSKDFSFNDEAVFLNYLPAAHTNGDTLVYFRRSDVIVTGDVFMTTTYPVIDTKNGGTVQGFIDALNRVLDLAVPKKQEEGGTYVIPGHGRVSDEADVLEYRDMLVIVRDRIADLIKKGMTLDQVKAARPSLDFDPRYGAPSGPSSTAQFVETVFRDLSQKKK
jgi:glyoxylase-like metal-dependent hydrolase (beta-lactamase superfamily II)